MAEMNMRELAVGIFQVERDRSSGLAGATTDLGKLFGAFLEHPIHQVMAVCSKMRPSVDISVF